MENKIEKLKQLNIDTDAQKAFKPQFLQAVKRFGKVALVSSMLALNMACQQPTGPEPTPIPSIEQPENPGNNPEYPENTPTNPGNNPTNPENPNGGNEEQTDQAVQNVISLIDALPNANDITAENKATVQTQINAIEAAYAELTAEQKQQVTNYSKVTAAKNKIAAIEEELNHGNNPQQNQFPEPTTTTLGDYTMYDFVQNNTIQYGSPLREMELNYLQKAEGYIQNNLNALSNSAKQNTTISNAINYYNQNAKKHYQEGTYTDIGAAHNETQNAFVEIFKETSKKQPYQSYRDAYKLCYEILANEAYKYGLGDCATTSGLNSKYITAKTRLISEAKDDPIFQNQNINIENVYSTNNFSPIISLLKTWFLEPAAGKIDGVATEDLQKFINIAFITQSLDALAGLEYNAGLNMTSVVDVIPFYIENPNRQNTQNNEMGL